MTLVNVIVAFINLCMKYKAKANSKVQKVGDVNKCVKRRWCCASVPLVSAS